MLTLKGKAFQVKPSRPQVIALIKFLNKSKTGQLFTPAELGKVLGCSKVSISDYATKGNGPELIPYSTVWRKQKLFGKPATIKLLLAEIKATRL